MLYSLAKKFQKIFYIMWLSQQKFITTFNQFNPLNDISITQIFHIKIIWSELFSFINYFHANVKDKNAIHI